MPDHINQEKGMPEDVIFALDIGTRTIIGLVGIQQEERFIIQAAEVMEHTSRAMLDGQIHDISKVVTGVKKVKESLESKLGYTLDKVSIAAAGRVLKTCQVTIEKEIEEGREIDSQMVSAIEMEGIHKAQLEIEKDLEQKEKNQFYCVGYSVVSYYLNDYVISSLQGHKGKKAGVEILATFLPQMVVDSLYTVVERTGLEVTHLTLEPIAALNVAIPKDLRLLNLALVDIGAGTSDIAITKSGTVIAYAMVPIAGDELTEAIAQHYLVDFNTAEKVKLDLSLDKDNIEFTDILDNKVLVNPEEVSQVIAPVIDLLARTITEKVLEYNGGKSPNAIFLVGGGSQAKGLADAVSDYIGLPRERVAVRNRGIAKNIIMDNDILNGPESVTPFGILVTTAQNKGKDFFYVTVNNTRVKMYNSRKMSVSDALVLAGFNPDQLICKSGKPLKFVLNGQSRTVRGSLGKPAEISVNNALSSLNTQIVPGDIIVVTPAERGTDGFAKAEDFIPEVSPVTLKWNGGIFTYNPKVFINGVEVGVNTVIHENDNVDIITDCTIKDVAGQFEIDTIRFDFIVNGGIKDPDFHLKGGEVIECAVRHITPVETKIPEKNPEEDASVMAAVTETPSQQQVKSDEGLNVTINGEIVQLPPKNSGYLFIDVFNYIDFDLTDPKGIIKLKLNGNDAGYTDVIKSGDVIDIYWRE